MLHKTQGIVLGTTLYNDTYSLTHVFTRDFGRVTYLLPKAHGRRQKISTSLFFPLSVLYLEVEHMPLRDIQRLKDAERQFPLYEINTDMTKISLAFFLSEFLSRVLRESDHNDRIFDYLKNSVETLEAAAKGLANFHLAFMVGLTRYLGVYPNVNFVGSNSYFDLLNGEFVMRRPLHTHYLSREQSVFLSSLHRMDYGNMHLFRLSRQNRHTIVNYLLEYYRLHIDDFPPLKSLEVLRELG